MDFACCQRPQIFNKSTDLYFPEDEGGLIWNDPEVGIEWPVESPSLSEKDLALPTLDQIRRGVA